MVFKGRKSAAKSLESAERLRALTEALTFRKIRPAVKSTISTGMTIYRQGEPIDDFLTRADPALYTAKNSGKNKVVYVPPPDRQETSV